MYSLYIISSKDHFCLDGFFNTQFQELEQLKTQTVSMFYIFTPNESQFERN